MNASDLDRSLGELRKRPVLVTGATGIVGSWLVQRLLDDGFSVVALIRDSDPCTQLFRSGAAEGCSIVNGDLADFATVTRAVTENEVGTVFHLGAQTIVSTALRAPLETFESNIRGTYNVLEACRVHSDLVSTVVVASSDKAYGESDILPYTEDLPLQGRHPYDVSKSCGDLLALTYSETYGLPIKVARCGNIYGGGDLNWSRIVPGTIRSILRNEQPVIRSDGSMVRDYIFVDDVVDAYIRLAAWKPPSESPEPTFNFAHREGLRVVELVEIISTLMGRSDLQPRVLGSARNEIQAQVLDYQKARNLLGWEPKHSLRDGLSRTIDWYTGFFGAAN